MVAIVADNSLGRGFGPEEPIGTSALARPGRGRFNLTVYHAQVRVRARVRVRVRVDHS